MTGPTALRAWLDSLDVEDPGCPPADVLAEIETALDGATSGGAVRSEHLTQQRARVYAALHGQRLVRTGALGRTRALDAPEMQRIAAIAVDALRLGARS